MRALDIKKGGLQRREREDRIIKVYDFDTCTKCM